MPSPIQFTPPIVPNGGIDESIAPEKLPREKWRQATNVEALPNGARARRGSSAVSSFSVVNNPPVADELYAWYKADSITGLSSGDEVTTWNDLSGNGFHLTSTGWHWLGAGSPAASSRRPKWYAAADASGKSTSNLACVSSESNPWAGIGHAGFFTMSTPFTIGKDINGYTICFIRKSWTDGGSPPNLHTDLRARTLFGQGPTGGGRGIYDQGSDGSGNPPDYPQACNYNMSYGVPSPGPNFFSTGGTFNHLSGQHYVILRCDKTTGSLWAWHDGVALSQHPTFPTETAPSRTIQAIMADSDVASWIQFWHYSSLGELFIYNKAFSAAEITAMNTYLAARI